jgi:hypothetical protein
VSDRDRHAKAREVMASALLELLGNIDLSSLPARAAVPAALPAPPEPQKTNGEVLGEPLSIRQVANLIGCSAWTVRQKYVPAGLPHLRSTPNGKLIFYKNQVIDWLLERQRKGGKRL